LAAAVLAVDGLSKWYGSQQALEGVSFEIDAGETAALLGENGAGKSTLAKILAGSVAPDAGHLVLDGQPITFGSPREALTHGIAFIPQELVYVPRLTVAENICLGRWPQRFGATSPRRVRQQAASEAARFGFRLPLDREMASLSVAQQQMVEILKAVARNSRVIVLDEPTAALGNADSERLLALIGDLAKKGVAAIYISHRLDEVFRACDSVHVLRNGQLVHSSRVTDTEPRTIVEHMLGRAIEETTLDKHAQPDRAPVLEARGWRREAEPRLRDVSFRVGAGEIVGIYGLRGSGAETIAETLGGLHRDVQGDTSVDGVALHAVRGPRAARRAGIAYVPPDRKSQGLVLTLPVQQSLSLLVLRSLSRLGVVARRSERSLAQQLADDVQLRSRGLRQTVGDLSGGNQQKVLVGSRLATRPKVLVLQEPTRGVDVGARLEIHRLLRDLADDGAAVLLVSSDIEEVVNVCDRLLVAREGEIVHEIRMPDLSSQSEAITAAGGLD
jgi:ABC-type sugar transport system ATPase subunit